jgi:hypothetical protein
MKKVFPYFLVLILATVTACGGSSENAETTEEQVNTAGMVELDLNPYGMPLSIMVPDQSVGAAEVLPNEFGGVDIRVGKNYAVSLAFGDGDVVLRRTDLQDDLVYESTIHTNEANLLVYERNIPGASIDPEHHFYFTTTIGADVFDVQNLVEQTYGKAAIEKMVISAKTLKAKTAG